MNPSTKTRQTLPQFPTEIKCVQPIHTRYEHMCSLQMCSNTFL